MELKLISIKKIVCRIKLMSGLHIGGGDVNLHIGGTDSPVVKHPHTNEPYIPGSSLKGKIRTLLELRTGLVTKSNGKPLSCESLRWATDENRVLCEAILKLFGTSGSDSQADVEELGPTRISFGDSLINREILKMIRKERLALTEVKSENSIDRIKGSAEHPRFSERVPSGIEFDLEIYLKEFEGDKGLEEILLEGMKLLEYDALGGSGSRGYGRVRFEFDDQDVQNRFSAITL